MQVFYAGHGMLHNVPLSELLWDGNPNLLAKHLKRLTEFNGFEDMTCTDTIELLRRLLGFRVCALTEQLNTKHLERPKVCVRLKRGSSLSSRELA